MKLPPIKAAKTLGISIEENCCYLAVMTCSGTSVCIENLYTVEIPPSDQKEETKNYFAKIRQIISQHDDGLIVSGITSKKLKVIDLQIDAVTDSLIKEALPFQLESHITFPAEEAQYVHRIREKKENISSLSVFVTKKQWMEEFRLSLEEKGIIPEIITADLIALNDLVGFISPKMCYRFTVLPLQDETICLLSCNGVSLASRSLKGGHSVGVSDALEVFRTYEGMRQKFTDIKEYTTEILLLSEDKGLKEDLQKHLDPNTLIRSLTLVGVWEIKDLPSFSQKFLLAIAYAFFALDLPQKGSPLLYFTPSSWPPQKQMKRMGKKLLPTAGLYLFALIAFYIFAYSFSGREKELITRLHVQVIQEIENWTGSTVRDVDVHLPLQNAIPSTLQQVSKLLKQSRYPYPLFPNTPKVSEVLAWLAVHPNVAGEPELNEALIVIQKFKYVLSKHPTKKSPRERYMAKVEIEFTTQLPRYAREFHEALQKEKRFINQKYPLDWTPKKGSYHIAFTLRDRTQYLR